VARRGLDRARVVDAAAALADADGLDAVTLARVANALGVRPPSLYNHIAGRDALLREVALRGVRELTDALRSAAVGRAGPDAVAAVARAQRAYARAHPGQYAASVRAPAPADADHRDAAAQATAVVDGALRAWRLEGDDLVHAVRAVRSAVHGFVALEAGGGFGLPVAREASFERLVAMLVDGLGEPPAQ
jgi:AcrR family transcriptional regulator